MIIKFRPRIRIAIRLAFEIEAVYKCPVITLCYAEKPERFKFFLEPADITSAFFTSLNLRVSFFGGWFP